jgi:hypothetical protein
MLLYRYCASENWRLSWETLHAVRGRPEISQLTTHLLIRDAIVFEKDEAIVADSDLDLLDELGDDRRVIRVHLAQVNRRELGKVMCLLGGSRGYPGGHEGFAAESRGRRVEGSSWCHDGTLDVRIDG